MAYKKFVFDPEGGFSDGSFYEDTPENPREILQRQHNQTRDYINSVVDTLNSQNEGSSGSESIMSPKIEGVSGENVFEQLKDIKRQINDTAQAVIPDASVTGDKIKDGVITESKIGDKEISTEKFKEDAKCPFAEEALHINGIENSKYLPVESTGFCGILKELMCKEKLDSINGKTIGSKRYIIKDSLLYILNLESGELEKFGDQRLPDSCKIAVLDENTVYYAIQTVGINHIANLYIYRYERKYGDITEVGNIELFDVFFTHLSFFDIDVNEEYFFIGAGRSVDGLYYNYYYKIPIGEIERGTKPEAYYSYIDRVCADSFFLYDGDVFFGTKIFKNTETTEILTLYSNIVSCDSYGNILTRNSSLPVCDMETQLPKCADLYPASSAKDGFIYEKYLYALVEGYLFRTRIF